MSSVKGLVLASDVLTRLGSDSLENLFMKYRIGSQSLDIMSNEGMFRNPKVFEGVSYIGSVYTISCFGKTIRCSMHCAFFALNTITKVADFVFAQNLDQSVHKILMRTGDINGVTGMSEYCSFEKSFNDGIEIMYHLVFDDDSSLVANNFVIKVG